MEIPIQVIIGIVLFLLILVPFLIVETRRGKRTGRGPFGWRFPRGHSETGTDTGRGPGGRMTEPQRR